MVMALCALALSLPACDDDDFDPALVTGVDWTLDSLQRPDFAVLRVAPGLYTLRLEPDGRLSARSDCNRCAGRYTLSGSSFTVGALACTRAFCGDASLDQPYAAALQSAQTIDGDDDRLVVSGGEGTLRYVR
jgi:heat shock protein HslJ